AGQQIEQRPGSLARVGGGGGGGGAARVGQIAAVPVKVESFEADARIDKESLHRLKQREAVLLVCRRREAEAAEDGGDQFGFEMFGEVFQHRGHGFLLHDGQQRPGKLIDVPVQRLGLAAIGVQAGLVEIGGGEGEVVGGGEAPRPVIEALGGDVDV